MATQATANTVTTLPSLLEAFGESGQPGGAGVVVQQLERGVVSIQLPAAEPITAADVTIIREQLIAAFAGEPRGLLLSLNGVGSIDRAAMTDYVKAVTVTALALVGRTPVDRVLANRILGIRSPQCPSRYFTDTTEAITWLRTRDPRHEQD